MGSTAIFFETKYSDINSTESTENAKCLKPKASGKLGLAGEFGKENNSICPR